MTGPATAGLPGTRRVVRRVLATMFGPPPFDPDADPGDPGLTGPGSASWRVIREPAAIAGGIRGLIVQLSHPAAMAGVYDHSAFREDPLGRLQRTSGYITTSTYGSTREALQVARRVRGAHARVHGTTPEGRAYRADDPDLLTWVSVALTSSFLEADRLWAPRPVSPADADAFVAEQSRIGALLDPRVDLRTLATDEQALEELRTGRLSLPLLEEGWLPTTEQQLHARLEGFRPQLGINHQGREALRFLARPPLPVPARASYRTVFHGCLGSLGEHQRDALELRLTPARASIARARARAVIGALRITSGTSPSERAAHRRAHAS